MLDVLNSNLCKNQAYINGQWCDADSGATVAVVNPATGDTIRTVPVMGAAETRRAITAANDALPQWREKLAKERADILRRWYELMMENQEELAVIMTSEQGKPLPEARLEIQFAAGFLEWFSEEARRIYGETIPQHQADKRLVVIKQPIGVIAAITPWNFPAAMITRKLGPALAVGCTCVCKPATATPLSALALAELGEQAGIPPGVINILTGQARAIGGEITANPIIRKISFTGSTEIGKKLLADSAATVKRTSMELGGNAPFIIFQDADLDAAVEGVVACKFRNMGQTCVCANRIYVQEAIYDVFSEKLAARVQKLKIGNGLEPGIEQGPLIDMAAVAKTEEHIADALKKGAKIITGGKRHALGGSFFEPTILKNVSVNACVSKEETFGPLAPLLRFRSEEEVIKLANDTEFGLASYFYSRDIGRIWRVSEALEYGMVGVNSGVISHPVAPFGGIKESGSGREGSHHGMNEYLEIKYICMGGIDS